MDLCQSCKAAVEALYPQAKHDRPAQIALEWQVPMLHHDTFNDCWTCYRLAKWLKTHDEDRLNSWLQAPLSVTYKYLGLMTAKFPLSFRQVYSYVIMVAPGHSLHEAHDDGIVVELACVDKSTYHIMMDACQPHQSSQIDFALIQKWISTCSTHKKCSESNTFLPMRLIRTSDDGLTASLIQTEEEFGGPTTIRYQSQRYITLSHRWSELKFKELRADTLHELQQGIVVSTLPQVFQDAFIVAARTGVTLVWIDSLCIMQEKDGDDLKIQCQAMRKIYASAFLNISATGCETNQGSMLNRRPRTTNSKPQTFMAKYSFFPRRRYVVEGHVWIDEIGNAPLSAKGWVFQERHLARRVLHLGSNLMAWECRELDTLEICPEGLPEKIKLNSLAKRDLFQRLEETRLGVKGALSYAYATWREMVEDYSRCELTYSSDKLLALRGLAACFGDTFGSDEYVAGTWKGSLVMDLLWHRNHCSENGIAPERAPSWSWASVDGEIGFPHGLSSVATRSRVDGIRYVRDPPDTHAIGRSTELKTSIALKGTLFKFECQWQDENLSSFIIGGCATFPTFGGTPCNSVYVDGPICEFRAYNDLIFLVLATSNVSIHGLVLTRLEGQSCTYSDWAQWKWL